MTMKENLKNNLDRDLSDLLRNYAKRKDFSAGEFTSALNKFSLRLTYEMTDNIIAATGLVTTCWNTVLTEIATEENEIVFEADPSLDDEVNTKKIKH